MIVRAYASGFFAVCGMLLLGGMTPVRSQSPAAFGQQLYVMKTLKPDLKTVGVIGTRLSDKVVQAIVRAGINQRVEVVIARPKNLTDVGTMYKTLSSEKKVEFLWLPDAEDAMILSGHGFDFLRETATIDGIGIIVPTEALVPGGALCSVTIDAGRVKVFINKRVAQVIGLNVPVDPASAVLFVAQ